MTEDEKELIALKLDAERYRWLRQNFDDNWGGNYFRRHVSGHFILKQARALDAAVDLEMTTKNSWEKRTCQ